MKISFQNRKLPCYKISFIGQNIKNITKIEQKRMSLFTFLAFLMQKLIYTINT